MSLPNTEITDKCIEVLFYNHGGEVSGAEINLLSTIDNLVHVNNLLVAPEGELLARGRQLGVRVVAMAGYRARMTRNPFLLLRGIWGLLESGAQLRRLVVTEQPQILHANSIRSGLIGYIATVGAHTSLIWHVQDALPKNWVGFAIRTLASTRSVKRILAISEAIQQNFADRDTLLSKTEIVYNGVNVSDQAWQSLREELRTPKHTVVFAVVGQIARWKRQQDAIRALAMLLGSQGSLGDEEESYLSGALEVELWIVGEPKFREDNTVFFEEIKELAGELGVVDQVRFLGFRKDVMNVMHSIDVLLLPSDTEPFGRVVIEAMLTGRPVIGTNAGGVPEIIEDGVTGFLFPIGDVAAMSRCMKELCESREKAIDMGSRGRERVQDKFSIQATAEKVRSVYEQVLMDG